MLPTHEHRTGSVHGSGQGPVHGAGRPVELRHFRAFLAVADAGNVTRAAAALRLTQPAVSRTLAALEQHLGVRLVDRSTHHLALTPEGVVFRDKAAAAVAAFDEAVDSGGLRRLAAAARARLVRVRPVHHTAAPQLAGAVPGDPLELLRIDDRTAGLTRGEVDAALLRGPVDAPGLVTEVLFSEDRVAAVTADGPLAAHPRSVSPIWRTAPSSSTPSPAPPPSTCGRRTPAPPPRSPSPTPTTG